MSQREFLSDEAEHGVIGALLLKPDLCEDIGARLSSADFHHADHQELYSMILALHSKGVKPDVITLSDYKAMLPSGEPTVYVASTIQRNIVTWANARQYAKIVMDRALARRAYDAAMDIVRMVEEEGDIRTVLATAQQNLADLAVNENTPDVTNYKQLLAGMVDRLDYRREKNGADLVRFGIPNLDKAIKGLMPGDLVIIAGKPGTGKTVMATGLADKIAIKDGKSSLIFSLEMPKEQLIDRTVSSISEIEKDRIDSGELLDDDWPKLTKAVATLDAADVRVCDKPALPFSRLCNIARFQHRAKPLHLIVVDYLTLIRSDANTRHASRSAEVGSHTRGLKALAKELGIPVVVLAQLNRGMDSRADARPRLSDLRDSGEIEQDADIVILGYRDEKSPEGKSGITEWEVAKYRNGRLNIVKLQFIGKWQKFVNPPASDAYSYESLAERTGRTSAPLDLNSLEPGGFDG